MNTTPITLQSLFLQLGLPNHQADIDAFVRSHKLKDTEHLIDARFWNSSQQSFLHEAWHEDADWVFVIDELDSHLHH